MDCLFCKIANGDIPANLIYQDDKVIAFDDIHPQAPQHKIIMPLKHIATYNELNSEDFDLIANMTQVAVKLAKQLNLAERQENYLMKCTLTSAIHANCSKNI